MTARLAIVGGGNMGASVARGVLAASIIADPSRIVIAEPDMTKHASLHEIGRAVPDARSAIAQLDPDGVLLLAVKPQVFPVVAAECREIGDRLVVSVMAGVRSDEIARALGGACRVVRVMPNLPVAVSLGMSAICRGSRATDSDVGWARAAFGSVGKTEDMSEDLMDAFTATAGSGPAYLFYLAEAMVRGAVQTGMQPEIADRVVRQTLLGASALLAREDVAPEVWRARVTSRGGTTAAAVEVLDAANVQDILARAIVAGRDRGRALGGSGQTENKQS